MNKTLKIKGIRRKKEHKVFDIVSFENRIKNYFLIEINDYVSDSYIKNVFLNKEAIRAIHDHVEESLKQDSVHEVGGFLMGGFYSNQKSSHQRRLIIEKYLPDLAVTYSSPTRLEFGLKVLEAVSEEEQKSDGLKLIGWFHTHPGHTPYLSLFDMNIHQRLFKGMMDIAIVLDSKTSSFDTGIFCRKESGEVNNKVDYFLTDGDRINWINWKSINRWAAS